MVDWSFGSATGPCKVVLCVRGDHGGTRTISAHPPAG